MKLFALIVTVLVGDWTAVIKVGDASYRLALHVTESQKGLQATFDSIDQKVMGMPVDKIELKGQQPVARPPLGLFQLGQRRGHRAPAQEIRGGQEHVLERAGTEARGDQRRQGWGVRHGECAVTSKSQAIETPARHSHSPVRPAS